LHGIFSTARKTQLCASRLAGVDVSEQLYNHMVMERIIHDTTPTSLDAVFSALADPTRRAILKRLSHSEASVSELAEPFEISQPAVSKHLKVLTNAGLISRSVDKQKRIARLDAAPMADAMSWLGEFREFWSSNFDQLEALLKELQTQKDNEQNDL